MVPLLDEWALNTTPGYLPGQQKNRYDAPLRRARSNAITPTRPAPAANQPQSCLATPQAALASPVPMSTGPAQHNTAATSSPTVQRSDIRYLPAGRFGSLASARSRAP